MKRSEITPPYTPNKRVRRLSISTAGTTRRVLVPKKKMKVNRIGKRNIRSNDVTVFARGKKMPRKKRVKVSYNLRQKIKKVIKGKEYKGLFQETAYRPLRWFSTFDNLQVVVPAMCTGSDQDAYFSPRRILDAASVLWNKKTQSQNNKGLIETDNMDRNKLKCTLVKSSVTYNIRNNTQRGGTIKIMEFTPRTNLTENEPLLNWSNSLANDAAVLNSSSIGPNQSGITFTQIHTNPGMLPQMRQLYKMHTTTLKIEPGANYTHFIQGPKNKEYNFQKMYQGDTFLSNIKDSVFVLFAYYPDLVTTVGGGLGRFMEHTPVQTQGFGIVVEEITRMTLSIPEQVGFVPAPLVAGDAQQLNQRQFSYAIRTYTQAGTGAVNMVFNENPIDTRQDPV